MDDLVTIDTFIHQVWNVEGVKVEVKQKEGSIEHLVRPYKYDRLSDDATVDDLRVRINECLNKPFIIFMNF